MAIQSQSSKRFNRVSDYRFTSKNVRIKFKIQNDQVKVPTASDMIKGTAEGQSGRKINGVFVQGLTDANVIFGSDTMTEQKSEEIEEFDLQVEPKVKCLTSNFFESKTVLGL